ncbi:MAG: hypothetical protein J7K98_02035 [Candidatus Aenigmarchaeota archaeon]|nr:hypothetical protein [Candidatus Aenigmarchaeota archaeon]
MNEWNYRICEVCLKNAHERVVMVREVLVSADIKGDNKKEMWVCPKCGATKFL